MSDEELKKAWFEENQPFGKKLGYPDCCIKEFCDQPPEIIGRHDPTEDDYIRYGAGCLDGKFTGFVPCLNHATAILNDRITLDSLIENRDVYFLPFPHETGEIY